MASPSIPEDKIRFVQLFGSIFEHSEWIAEVAWGFKPFANTTEVFNAMVTVLNKADEEQKLALIRAHPELAGKKAMSGNLTQASKNEQATAGLNNCTERELELITTYNRRYQDKFGFPFIVAVKSLNKAQIIEKFAERLKNNRENEFNECLKQIVMIAEFRIKKM